MSKKSVTRVKINFTIILHFFFCSSGALIYFLNFTNRKEPDRVRDSMSHYDATKKCANKRVIN